MFKLLYQLPEKCFVACSGGVDSMSALHFLARRVDRVLHVNHNTGIFADHSEVLVKKYCERNNFPLTVHTISSHPPEGKSKEEWWREQRYNFFKQYDHPVVLAHQLDDCVEEYLMCVLVRGFSSTIPYSHANCIRPFRMWPKEEIIAYAEKNGIPYVQDPSNQDVKYKRNYIRHKILPEVLNLNPGVANIVRRLMEKEVAR